MEKAQWPGDPVRLFPCMLVPCRYTYISRKQFMSSHTNNKIKTGVDASIEIKKNLLSNCRYVGSNVFRIRFFQWIRMQIKKIWIRNTEY